MNKILLKNTLAAIGFKIIHWPKTKFTPGPDLWVKRGNGRPLSLEIKNARKTGRGDYQTDPVQFARKNDDLIAIFCGRKYVLIEPMQDHLLACSPKGSRQLTKLLGKG